MCWICRGKAAPGANSSKKVSPILPFHNEFDVEWCSSNRLVETVCLSNQNSSFSRRPSSFEHSAKTFRTETSSDPRRKKKRSPCQSWSSGGTSWWVSSPMTDRWPLHRRWTAPNAAPASSTRSFHVALQFRSEAYQVSFKAKRRIFNKTDCHFD